MKSYLLTASALCLLSSLTMVSCKDGADNIVQAAERGDLEEVKDRHEDGADIDTKTGPLNSTALHHAAANGNTEMIEYLLKNGADKKIVDRKGETALFRAARNGHKKAVELLLSSDAAKAKMEVNATDKMEEKGFTSVRNTPLLAAAYKGHTGVVELLIEKGANVDHIDFNNNTALTLASRMEKTKEMSAADASAKRSATIAALAEKGADLDHKDSIGSTAMHYLAQADDVNTIKLLAEKKANLNVQNSAGATPLICAADYGSEDALKALIELQAELNHTDANGNTALMVAAAYGQKGCVEALMAAKADLSLTNKDGFNAFIIAAVADMKKEADKAKQIEIAKMISAQNPAVVPTPETVAQLTQDIMDRPLVVYPDFLDRLQTAGVDLNAKNAAGKTALQIAEENGYTEAVKAIKKALGQN